MITLINVTQEVRAIYCFRSDVQFKTTDKGAALSETVPPPPAIGSEITNRPPFETTSYGNVRGGVGKFSDVWNRAADLPIKR